MMVSKAATHKGHGNIEVYPRDSLGHVQWDWLDTRHHFSFSSYYNPRRMNFGKLRVINDDEIKPGRGFDFHPHQDMEIITYVRQGAITHRDDQGNHGRTVAGDIQVMSAGSGILHSEYNLEDETATLFQIWIQSNQKGVKPRWDTKSFPKEMVKDQLPLLVSGDGNAPLRIYQDAFIYGGKMPKGLTINHSIHHQAYVLVSNGRINIGDRELKKGDGAEVTDFEVIRLHAQEDSEILVIDVPK